MQRYYDIVRDEFGNPAAGVTVSVYAAGTVNLATIYVDTGNDNPTTVKSNPILTGSDGVVAFAANDGDYDLYYYGSDITPYWKYRVNLFDSTTATTVPVSSISLAVPAEMINTGSPGTAMTITWDTQAANKVFAGPTTGAAATPTFRALVAADINGLAVDKTTNQTGLAGDKTWTGAHTFNGAVTNGSTLTQTGASSFAADVTFGANIDLIFDYTSKGCLNAAGTYGWKTHPFQYDGSTGAGTAPTITVLQSGIRKWGFSASATNEMIFALSLPTDYAEGTDLYPYVSWTTTGTNTGNVRWGIEYTMVKGWSQAAFPANTTAYVLSAGSGVALTPVTAEWAAISGTNLEAGSIVVCRMFRDGSNGADDQTGVAILLDFGVFYQSSRPFGCKDRSPGFYS